MNSPPETPHRCAARFAGRALLTGWWLLALAALGCAPAPPPTQVWFGPNVGSADLLRLFERPELWPEARRKTDVFKFYVQQVLADRPRDCRECGPNLHPALARLDAYARLNAWGIGIAVEAGAVKPWGCAAAVTLPPARRALRRIEAARGMVTDLALDEPLLGARECGLTLEQGARQTAAFARGARRGRPYLRVGLVEPYPALPPEVLLRWVGALRDQGFTPSFLHLDVDRRHAAQLGRDLPADLVRLRTELETGGIPFGVIFWSEESASDDAYYGDALGWLSQVGSAIGEPSHSIFQSWAASARGRRTVPANLPEGRAASFTHTRLLNEGLADLRGRPRPRLY